MLTIVCWKWKPEEGAKHQWKRDGFSAYHVNALRASVERNLTLSHRFVCVTDDFKGLHSSVETVNINRHFREFKDFGGCYRRLKAFDMATALACFGTKFISLDLDVVVTGNLDSLFQFDDFRIWEDSFHRRTPYCGSLWGMRSGAREFVYSDFLKDPEGCIRKAQAGKMMGTDQAHISRCLHPGETSWTIADGVYNYNTRVRRPNNQLPPNAKLVFFNGKYDPSQPELQRVCPWIGDYWRD